MIKINNVTKNYGNFNINLSLDDNEIIGLIGANGAGKTTLIRQIMGFIKSDEGSIIVDDLDAFEKRSQIMKNVGYISGEAKLPKQKTAKQFFNFIKTYNENLDDNYLSYLIDHFDLDVTKKISKLSKGNKQKVSIISALATKPKLLILDEPTSGLDPFLQNKFNKLILEFKKDGASILMCSHIVSDIEEICEKIIVIKKGKVVFFGDGKTIKSKYKNMNEFVEEIYSNKVGM